MFLPGDLSPCGRLKAGRGKSDPWPTSRLTPFSLPSPEPPGRACTGGRGGLCFLRRETTADQRRGKD
jgi:hypothetical protein